MYIHRIRSSGILMYKKLPGDCDVFKLHLADEKFPEMEPMIAVTCDTDDLSKVFESKNQRQLYHRDV